MFNIHIIIDDLEHFGIIRSHLNQRNDWHVTWGTGKAIPVDADLILIDAKRFGNTKAENTQIFQHKIMIVYGTLNQLNTSFLLGCDDYIKSPWTVEEIFYRIAKFSHHLPYFFIDNHKIVIYANHVLCGIERVPVTLMESCILTLLARHKNTTLTSQSIYHSTINGTLPSSDNEVHVYMCTIRKKLEQFSCITNGKEVIVTVPKKGYFLQSD